MLPAACAALAALLSGCGTHGAAPLHRSKTASFVPQNVFGDYDDDEHGSPQAQNDLDEDDLTGRIDRDGEKDNRSGSYFDPDDSLDLAFGRRASAHDAAIVASLVRR